MVALLFLSEGLHMHKMVFQRPSCVMSSWPVVSIQIIITYQRVRFNIHPLKIKLFHRNLTGRQDVQEQRVQSIIHVQQSV